MKKKLYALIGGLIVLAALFAVYLFITNNASDKTQNDTPQDISISDLGTQIISSDDVTSFNVENKNGSFSFNKKGDKWGVEGFNNTFNSTVIANMSSVFTSLYAEQVIEENVQDMSKYSLDHPVATAVSGDTKINLGTITTDGKYYYVSLNNEKTVYMVNSARVDCLQYGFNDIIDKSLPKIDSNSVQELSIDYRDKESILIKYDKDNPLAREYSKQNGLATLVMEKPVENILVYPYNLQASVLMNLESLNISDLVELNPSDLSKYGLNDPVCTIHIADNENQTNVKVGNFVQDSDTENQYVYALVNNRPEVFTINYRAIKPFMEAQIADFAEKFVSLYQRSKVDKIIITGDKEYTIDFKAEGENDFRDIDGVQKDYRNTYINKKLIDKDTFTDFYELLVGIGFDNITPEKVIGEKPSVTITFELSDGSKDVSQYYDYDTNFYIVNKGDTSSMLVSKQTVRRVLSEIENIAK